MSSRLLVNSVRTSQSAERTSSRSWDWSIRSWIQKVTNTPRIIEIESNKTLFTEAFI